MQIQSAPLLDDIMKFKGGNIPWHYETVHTIPGEDMNRYEMIEEIKVAQVAMAAMSTCISTHDISEPTPILPNADGSFAPIDNLDTELESIHGHMDEFNDFLLCLKKLILIIFVEIYPKLSFDEHFTT